MPDLYEYKTGAEQIKAEARQEWTVSGITYDNGVEVHIEGAEYPYKGMATPQAIFAANVLKRMAMEAMRVAKASKLATLALAFQCLMDTRFIETLLRSFNHIGNRIMTPYILKDMYLVSFSREIKTFVYDIFDHIGHDWQYKPKTESQFATLFAHIFEYDAAYRFRMQDIFSATTKEQLMTHPRREIKRLMKLVKDRDYKDVFDKFLIFGTMIRLLLLIPSFKKAFRYALERSTFSNFQYDESDKYWVCQRTDYQYMGLTKHERRELIKDMKIPKAHNVI